MNNITKIFYILTDKTVIFTIIVLSIIIISMLIPTKEDKYMKECIKVFRGEPIAKVSVKKICRSWYKEYELEQHRKYNKKVYDEAIRGLNEDLKRYKKNQNTNN